MFQNILFACALTSTLGLASIKEDIKPSYKNDEVSFRLDNKKMVSYDDEEHFITLSVEELNSYYFYNLCNYILDNSSLGIFSGMYVLYDSTELDFDDYDSVNLQFTDSTNYSVVLNVDNGDDTGLFFLNQFVAEDEVRQSFEYEIDLYVDENFYQAYKNAIELDIQANNPSDNMPQVLDDFVGVLTTAIGSLASGIAGGVTAMAQDLFLQDDGEGNITGLSVFGGIVALFAGLALAVAITTKVYTWVTTLGN